MKYLVLFLAVLSLSTNVLARRHYDPPKPAPQKPFAGISVPPLKTVTLVIPKDNHAKGYNLSCLIEIERYSRPSPFDIFVGNDRVNLTHQGRYYYFIHKHVEGEKDLLEFEIKNMSNMSTVIFKECKSS